MNDKPSDNRVFPRTKAICPVLYRIQGTNRWYVSILNNLSATGLQMKCKESISQGSTLDIQLKPGSNKLIPALQATGIVIRTELNPEKEQLVSCKLIKISSQSSR